MSKINALTWILKNLWLKFEREEKFINSYLLKDILQHFASISEFLIQEVIDLCKALGCTNDAMLALSKLVWRIPFVIKEFRLLEKAMASGYEYQLA